MAIMASMQPESGRIVNADSDFLHLPENGSYCAELTPMVWSGFG